MTLLEKVAKNLGGYDRKIRLIASTALLLGAISGFVVSELAVLSAFTLSLAAVLVLFTVATQRCPVNALLGIDTCIAATDATTREDASQE